MVAHVLLAAAAAARLVVPGRADRFLEAGADLFEHADHFRHRARQPAHFRVEPARLPPQLVACDATAEQLLCADVGGGRLPWDDADPNPQRTIALMISTFSVSITTSASIRSRLKNSSTRLRVTDPVSNRINGCLFRSAGRICRFFAEWVRPIRDEQQLFLKDGHRHQVGGFHRQCDQS